MIFTELVFFPFFLVAFAVHWALRSNTHRKVWLLLCSYAFYGSWDWRFLSLILISTVVDYVVGCALGTTQDAKKRKRWLYLSLISNLSLLGVFKYFNFFVQSAVQLLTSVGMTVSYQRLAIVLPVGISFYTFQTLSYSIDVYRGKLEPRRSPLDVALFVAFFPQLVAGPIVRAKDFLPQLDLKRSFSRVQLRSCFTLFLVGFIKKACISDNIAGMVDSLYAAPQNYDALSAWIATLGYAVQIYCDFSGYSDMAIACGGLLGYNLCINFAHPYFAVSIQDFWRRWHISLSSWLRDYLYISLGGNRGGELYRYRNLALTMLLGGLWHGAAWQFVVWGALHGAALVVHRELTRRIDFNRLLGRAAPVLGALATFYVVCVAWVFFRAPDWSHALVIADSVVLWTDHGSKVIPRDWLALFAVLGVVHWAAYRRWWARRVETLNVWLFVPGYAAAWVLALAFIPPNAAPFIYFQF